MANFSTINQAFYTQFVSDVYMLARQEMSIYLPLVDLVSAGGKPGERMVFNRLSDIEFEEITDRYQELEANTIAKSARSLTFRKYHCHVTVDAIDDMRMIYDPSGPYVRAISAAYAKKVDQLIKDAMLGSADNKDGTSSTSVTAATSLSTIDFSEVVAIRDHFQSNFVAPSERIYNMIGGAAYKDLMAINQFISFDYNNSKPVSTGAVGQLLGMDFIYDPNLGLYTDGSSAQMISFVRPGIKVALPQDLSISIDRIPERRNALLIQAEFAFGAVRMEESKVRWSYLTND